MVDPGSIDLLSYPLMPAGWLLHLAPGYGFVHRARGRTNDIPAVLEGIANEASFVDEEGADILSLCDGTRRGVEVVSLVCQNHRSLGEEECVRFLQEATGRGHIKWLLYPSPRSEVMITGSKDYYVPLHLSLELTSSCNLSCVYCYCPFDKADHQLQAGQLIDILSRWRDLGLVGIEITGGEPLLHSDFFAILEFCASYFFPLGILTNGTLIDERVACTIAEIAPHAVFSISLDGARASTHDRMRGMPGSFEKTTRGIANLAKAGLKVRVAMQVSPFNFGELEETLMLARSLGARWFGWSPILPFGRGKQLAWQWDSSLASMIAETEQRLHNTFPDFVVSIGQEALVFLRDFGNCGLGYKHAVLSPVGKIRPCLFMEDSQSIGDVKQADLTEIFRNPDVGLLRSLSVPQPDACYPCRYASYCAYCPLRPVTVFEREGRWCKWGYENLSRISLFRNDKMGYDSSRPIFE